MNRIIQSPNTQLIKKLYRSSDKLSDGPNCYCCGAPMAYQTQKESPYCLNKKCQARMTLSPINGKLIEVTEVINYFDISKCEMQGNVVEEIYWKIGWNLTDNTTHIIEVHMYDNGRYSDSKTLLLFEYLVPFDTDLKKIKLWMTFS